MVYGGRLYARGLLAFLVPRGFGRQTQVHISAFEAKRLPASSGGNVYGATLPSRAINSATFSASDYVIRVRQPLHGLLVDYCNDADLGQRSEINSSSDTREILQIALGGLHSRKQEGDRVQRRQNLEVRRTLEWMLHLFNKQAHDHDLEPELYASALATAVHVFLHKNPHVNGRQRSQLVEMGTPFWNNKANQTEPTESGGEGSPGAVSVSVLSGASGEASAVEADDETDSCEVRTPSELRAELRELKAEIDEHYSTTRARLEPWEHILQNSKLDDLIHASPKDKSELQTWVSALRSFSRNREIMNDQVERFHGEVLSILWPASSKI